MISTLFKCHKFPHLGNCAKKHLLIFCLTETGEGGRGSHKNNCLTTYKFEQMFESVFCDIFCFKDNSPKPPPSNFPQNTPPREVILMIFFLLSSRSTGLVVKKQGFFPKPLCSPWPFLQFFWKKQGSHVFFFNVHSLEHFDHFLLPPKNRSFASWFVA